MDKRITTLKNTLETFYKENGKGLLFHGWHHIVFVWKKSIVFAKELGADEILVQAASLTHDLNYAVVKNSLASAGEELRSTFLQESGFSESEIIRINDIIIEEEFSLRDENISIEAKALSDADTLFKVLPLTPILFAGKYIQENDTDIQKLAEKIVSEQTRLFEKDIFFYSDSAREKYDKWAKQGLELWRSVQESYEDEDMVEMLQLSENFHKK